MPIKLDWIDQAGPADSHKVYRSLTKIDPGNLGTPLATLGGGVTTYTDNTVQRNVTYHYVVTSIIGEDEAPSAEYVIAYIPYTGPGPQTLLRGNWEYGYFGRVPLEDILSSTELIQATDQPVGSPNGAANYWFKIVYKGKILFFPKDHVALGISFSNLYKAGCVYGNIPSANWPTAVKTYLGTIPQGRIIKSQSHQFVVRLPTSRADMLSTGSASVDQRGGEIDTIFAAMYLVREFNTDNIPTFDDNLVTASSVRFMTTDWLSGSGTGQIMVTRTNNLAGNLDSVTPTGTGLSIDSASGYWLPVLELVT